MSTDKDTSKAASYTFDLQLLCCVIGGLVGLLAAFRSDFALAGGILAMIAVYGALSYLMYEGSGWAWWLCLMPPAFVVICVGPWAAYNFFAYFTDHPKYLDSPATILVVAIVCVVVLLPALLLVSLMMFTKIRAKTPNTEPE
jgi:carbon starvation protein CstA